MKLIKKRYINHGFTLIEIMIAISLIAILLSAIGGICFPLKKSIVQAREQQAIQEELSVVWDRLSQDLSFTFVPNGIEEHPFKGEAGRMAFYCLDSIRFAAEPFLPGARKVVYEVQKGGTALEWSEDPLVSTNKKGKPYLLGQGFRQFQFHYLNKAGAWMRQWHEKEWPKAVRVLGLYISKNGNEVSFEKTFYPKS